MPFIKGYKHPPETPEQKQRRIEALKLAWRNREDYTGGLLGSKIHNSWRAFRFTIRGQKAGCSESWMSFNNFHSDMATSYIEGYKLKRMDTSKPFSKDNCYWIDRSMQFIENDRTITISYNGETLSMKEWAIKLNKSLHGIKIRYHKNKDYTVEDILLGRQVRKRRVREEDPIRIRASKLLSTYRIKDVRKRLIFDIEKDWFVQNILSKHCFYCGSKERIGADRLDNSLGHIKGNVVPCCHICNAIRGNVFSVSEMKQIGIVITEIRNQRRQTLQIDASIQRQN